ncbi:hypothetical protein H6785_02920 [Candidatus Nomurabacteria bacterium]|nr:hypothetical protein [Candidatus Nomurabacteria bacterium]
MTTVTDKKSISDENYARVMRVLHDAETRLLKGSLDPDAVVLVLSHLNGKGSRAENLIEYAKENCPKIDWKDKAKPKARRSRKSTTLFNEAEFFQTNDDLWVDTDLEKYVGFETRPSRHASALKCRPLTQNENEAQLFGLPGSPEHIKTITERAVDLGQIAGKIKAQAKGTEGELLNNGYANLFPVCGKDGSLRVVDVHWAAVDGRWFVYCNPFTPDFVWSAGRRMLSN